MGKLGENIVVAGAARYDDGGTIAAYVHPPANKIGVLVDLDGGDEALARQLAMHISFAAPEWATRDDVPAETIDGRAARSTSTRTRCSRSPRPAREKIVDGMLGKRFFAASPAASSSSRRGSTTSRRRSARRSQAAGATLKGFKRVSVAGS